MKKLAFLALCCSSLIGLQEEEKPAPKKDYTLWDFHPIHAGGNALWIGEAKISDTPEGGHFRFNKENAFLYMLLPISEKSYFFPRLEWNTISVDWNKNPKFNQSRYYYGQAALTFYSTAVEQWRWILRANYNLDLENMDRPHDYGLFEGLVWGAYQIHRKWHYHIGTFGYTGMEGAQVYPLLGFDYSPNKKWTFLIVFPIDYYIQYKVNDHWKLALKGRPLKERFRTGKSEPQPRSIFSYSSTGAELNVQYERFMRFEMEAFVGYNFGGSYYIKDAHNHNSLYTDVGGAPYAGANLNYGF